MYDGVGTSRLTMNSYCIDYETAIAEYRENFGNKRWSD